jgi:hypothetical protein
MLTVVTPDEVRNGNTTYQEKFLEDAIAHVNSVIETYVNTYKRDLQKDCLALNLSSYNSRWIYCHESTNFNFSHLNSATINKLAQYLREAGWVVRFLYVDEPLHSKSEIENREKESQRYWKLDSLSGEELERNKESLKEQLDGMRNARRDLVFMEITESIEALPVYKYYAAYDVKYRASEIYDE